MLLYTVTYQNHHSAAVIGKMELIGYSDSDFIIYLDPINHLTQDILKHTLEQSIMTPAF